MPKAELPLICITLTIALAFSSTVEAAEQLSLQGRGEFYLNKQNDTAYYLKPWWQQGTGQFGTHTEAGVGPAYLLAQLETDSDFSATVHAQWHRAPEAGFGVTEAWINWNPLPVSGYRVRGRAGIFYPALSLENTDLAWTSPYTNSFSAINSWIAEEIKTRAIELSVNRPGRFFKSDHSIQWVGALFQGNDPAGSILTWRGFALHNLQTSIGERVHFANYPSIAAGGEIELQPAWVEPNRELDHKTGYYTGLHWLHKDQTEMRLYWYDNRGEPTTFKHGQYAWDTRFLSLAFQHQLTEQWRLLAQVLSGDTSMGIQAVVADYQSSYLMLNYQLDRHSISARYDHFEVTDKDLTLTDDNNGKGHSWTFNWTYQLTAHLNLALEHSSLQSFQPNRTQWVGWQAHAKQRSSSLILGYRW
ncbi:hypothetical protein EMM73_13360 [Rheinheimera sediminis]|uniref:hypothetical protein n=1 Tax=Rheinheimera sp. YQF-1 TaxID=2499626 RepID=UPI000FD78908|nr:hypothetical protein [Rheinheimera sp. YQF-1]RVT45447.1 hypothetical protein EMM73_13360 [Rheinheimera sp. YQF-1]